jgi:hypothetical protein
MRIQELRRPRPAIARPTARHEEVLTANQEAKIAALVKRAVS